MRTSRRVVIVFLLFVVGVRARADEWENLRRRPGNDDLFVVIDTSHSMAGGSLAQAKTFLLDLFARYLKEGDRVVVMTFDSVARVHGFVRIENRRRDIELLRDVLAAIEVGRVIRYRGTWPDLIETADGPLRGGAAYADYCEMWRLSGRAMKGYGVPAHRQLFLLFTDGTSQSPDYRPCADPGPSLAIVSALRKGRLRAGVVVTNMRPEPSAGTSPASRGFVDRVSARRRIASDSWRVMELSGGGRVDGLRGFLGLLNARVDLVDPVQVDIAAGTTDLRVHLTVVNRSDVARKVAVTDASLHLRGDSVPMRLAVMPAAVTLAPRTSALLTLSADDLFDEAGDYRGEIRFQFENDGLFDPAVLAVQGRREPFLAQYRQGAAWALLLTGVGLTCLIRRWFATEKTRGEGWWRSKSAGRRRE